MESFRDYEWKLSYSTDIGSPVEEFYNPILTRAVSYDRITGYFSANALTIVARGLEKFIQNKGKMRLLVSVQLDEQDAKAIEKGYDLRKKVEEKLESVSFEDCNFWVQSGLSLLAQLIASGHLDIKVGLMKGRDGNPSAHSILHDKIGIFTDPQGNQISFIGSNNETGSGWELNSESFEVHCSWLDGNEKKRVQDKVNRFQTMWEGRSPTVITLDFPDAILQKLLVFQNLDTPMNEDLIFPPPKIEVPKEDSIVEEPESNSQERTAVEHSLTAEEVWNTILKEPTLPEGLGVSIATSIVEPWGHQIRNFVRAASKDPVRLLIADEVGLGKTISAGLILRHMILSGRAKRILLLAPGGVVTQWQNELYEKFNLNVPIYNGKELVYRRTHSQAESRITVGRSDWQKENFVIASTFLMRRRDRRSDLLQAEPYDFLLVDEVHHARRKGAGSTNEGPSNLLLQLLNDLVSKDLARSILFLSATPMQVHPVELWDLLRILGLPQEWNEERFLRYYEEMNTNLSDHSIGFLREQFQSYNNFFGEISEEEWHEKLTKQIPNRLVRKKIWDTLHDLSSISIRRLSHSEREHLKSALMEFNPVKALIARNTRNLLKYYFQQGILPHRIPNRKVIDIAIEMPPSEKILYEEVESYIKEAYRRGFQGGNRGNIGFILTIYRRRFASSYAALYKTLTKRLEQLKGKNQRFLSTEDLEDEDIAETDEDISENVDPFPTIFQEESKRINQLLGMIAKLGVPKKCIKLFEELDREASEGKSEAIIFTQFTDTLDFLIEKFLARFQGKVIGAYSGDGAFIYSEGNRTTLTKDQLKFKFMNGDIDYLLCTDAAAEGLNLQYAGLLVNYDLPWNPMKVEQRIGRIDRIGQKHEEIKILNFAYQETVEADIYFTLANRIELFTGIIGKLQPILSILKTELESVMQLEGDARKERMEVLMSELEVESRKQLQSNQDIDSFSEDHTKFPELPRPKINMQTLRVVFHDSKYRPHEFGWRALDEHSYELKYPGKNESFRVTFSKEVFDRDPLNHDFISYGNWIFDGILDRYRD